ncbi:MAG: zinc ribbon domain-containing protein [Prevotella sp.]
MFCHKCGKEVEDGIFFCPFCGVSLKPSDQNHSQQCCNDNFQSAYTLKDKNEGIALILSLLLSGIGQIYVGKIVRGLMFLIARIALGLISIAILFSSGFIMNNSISLSSGAIISIVFTSILSVALWIYGMYDAYSLAKEYNEYIDKNHQKPW